jgi:uncharacterized protein YdaL
MRKIFTYSLIILLSAGFTNAATYPNKKVLVLVEGDYNIKSYATGQGRQLVQLLGHFNTTVTIDGVNKYKVHDIDKYDYIFYVGFSEASLMPSEFCNDVANSAKPVIWMNTGFIDLCRKQDIEKRFGFTVKQFEKNSIYGFVKANDVIYAKGMPEINLIEIQNKKTVEVWATAFSVKPKKETPYMVKSGNLIYVADLPFTGATESDRYLYFADKLHDILNEQHAENHQAIIRIEDVTPLNDPDKLREVADILSERGIPFLVGVVPIYVDPGEDIRVKLTERPEVVDALKYMVQNGGSIVMHGVTHQYRGISTNDYEFWDGTSNKPINDENVEDIAKKIETGLDELIKNGIYPIAWETPHYTASNKTYEVVSRFFSTAVEQRMSIEDFDYGQYFPYIINKDIYGQKIFPENLGYVPLNPNLDSSRVYVEKIIKGSEMIHHVRDGIASCFFHPFLNLDLLKQLADGLKNEGYSFLDLRDYENWVKTHDKIILTGSQTYSLTIDNSYLLEVYYDKVGNIAKKIFSPDRVNGTFSKSISLQPGEFYMAEGIDYHIKEPTFKDKALHKFQETYTDIIGGNEWHEARVSLCWNQFARGASFYDQASLAAMFNSLNINVDTIFAGQDLDVSKSNLLVVPFSYINFLTYFDFNKIVRFVKDGGNLITDRRNKLIEKFDIKFFNVESRMQIIRDNYFPQEFISWKYSQLVNKFDYNDDDEIFCEDANTGLAAVIGRKYGNGKIIYFNTLFDPSTPHGYSNYPFAMEYVKKYFQLQPVFKRENLEVYFDPGLRQNTSVENLFKIWVKQGIRIIHIAGWHQYMKYDYDYQRVIRLAHANGILVYVWLEPPYISQKFWQKHPEWREKNYKNDDVISIWRYPVALTDPKCLETVIAEYMNFLKAYDWDGVNIGELHFEAGKGFDDPKLFTPMHPTACKEFKSKYGFDLKQIFDPTSLYYWKNNSKAKEDVVNYRVNKISEFHEKILDEFTKYAKSKSGFTIVVTFLDTYFSPENKLYYGVSSDKMIELQKKYDFLLQPEDPVNKWSTDPSRYVEFGKYYSRKMADSSKLAIDLNILTFRKKEEVTPFPTLLQTGIESYELINFSSVGAPRFTIYSEATCNPQDISFFPYASSSAIKYKYSEDGYTVNSPYSFVLQLPENIKVIEVDGKSIMGSRDNIFFIPSGNHIINFQKNNIPGFSTVELQPRLLTFTGNIMDLKYDMRRLSFNYECSDRALVSLNSKPTSIKVDSRDYRFEVLKGNDCFSFFLPVGKHTVQIATGDKFTYGIGLTSLWSISAIAIYGALAALALILMYFLLKVLRRTME